MYSTYCTYRYLEWLVHYRICANFDIESRFQTAARFLWQPVYIHSLSMTQDPRCAKSYMGLPEKGSPLLLILYPSAHSCFESAVSLLNFLSIVLHQVTFGVPFLPSAYFRASIPMQHSAVPAVSPFPTVSNHLHHLLHTTKITGCRQVLVPCVICDTNIAGDFLTCEKIIHWVYDNVNENTFMNEDKAQ